MNKKYIIAFAFILSTVMVKAQASGPNKITPDQLNKIRLNSNYDREVRYMFNLLAIKTNLESKIDTVAVNEYLAKTPYALGYIYYKGKKMPQKYQLRHNGLKDIIEIENEKEPDMILRNPRISCKIGSDKYVYSKINNGNEIKPGYLKEIYLGKNVSLYEKTLLIYKDPKKALTSLTPDVKARYVKFTYIFKRTKDNKVAIKVPSNKKAFLNEFDKQYRKDIKNYIKSNKLNLAKAKDVIKAYKYYEEISS